MAYYKPITRTMSIDTINVKTQPSDIYKDLMETDIEITEREFFEILDYYTTQEVIDRIGVKNILSEMDTDDIMSYLNDIGIQCQWEDNNQQITNE